MDKHDRWWNILIFIITYNGVNYGTDGKDLKYAQQLINVLQTKLNDSVALNIQLEAKLLTLQEEAKETTKEDKVDGNSNKTKEK